MYSMQPEIIVSACTKNRSIGPSIGQDKRGLLCYLPVLWRHSEPHPLWLDPFHNARQLHEPCLHDSVAQGHQSCMFPGFQHLIPGESTILRGSNREPKLGSCTHLKRICRVLTASETPPVTETSWNSGHPERIVHRHLHSMSVWGASLQHRLHKKQIEQTRLLADEACSHGVTVQNRFR